MTKPELRRLRESYPALLCKSDPAGQNTAGFLHHSENIGAITVPMASVLM